MQIRYCMKCGALINAKDSKEPKDTGDSKATEELCESCKAGKPPSFRGPADSAMISRKKLDAAREAHRKKGRGQGPGVRD